MTKNSYQLLGLGNALVDYQVAVEDSLLKRLGVEKGSMKLVSRAEQQALIFELKKSGLKIEKSSGGCAANTVVGFANYGGRAQFIGKVADDADGQFYHQDLETAQVRSLLNIEKKVNEESTGSCVALITPDAERTMLTYLGLAVSLAESDVTEAQIMASEIVYIEGYLWDSPSARAACRRAMELAHRHGKKVAFTFSDSFCVERHRADFIELAQKQIDILFCNEHEAIEATGISDSTRAFDELSTWTPAVAVSIGARGALLSQRLDGRRSSDCTKEMVPTWDIDLVDKLGAGDLFAAGVLWGMASGRNLREAGLLGCFSATRVIQQTSARLPYRLGELVDQALAGPSPDEAQRAAVGSGR